MDQYKLLLNSTTVYTSIVHGVNSKPSWCKILNFWAKFVRNLDEKKVNILLLELKYVIPKTDSTENTKKKNHASLIMGLMSGFACHEVRVACHKSPAPVTCPLTTTLCSFSCYDSGFSIDPALRPGRFIVLKCLFVCLFVCLSRAIYFFMMDVLLCQYNWDPQFFFYRFRTPYKMTIRGAG